MNSGLDEEAAEAISVRMWPMGEVTTIDAIARLHRFHSIAKLGEWADELPESIKSDDRFAKAVKRRLDEIKGKSIT